MSITGGEKLRKWKLKLPNNYREPLSDMFSAFNTNYKWRIDSSVDIYGQPFVLNSNLVCKLKGRCDQPLVRTGIMRKGIVATAADDTSVTIGFLDVKYDGITAETVASVASKHQYGSVEDNVVLTGYKEQQSGVFPEQVRLKRLEIPERAHFGIPEEDVELYLNIFAQSVKKHLQAKHGGVH